MGMIGGIGMLSAGWLGGPGIGYKQDYYASQKLQVDSAETYERYKASQESTFLVFPTITGLDGAKVGIVTERDGNGELAPATTLSQDFKLKTEQDRLDDETKKLYAWWNDEAKPMASADAKAIDEANLYGGRMALKWTAVVPLTMFVGYLLLFFYFQSTGGYVAEHLESLDSGAGEEEPAAYDQAAATDDEAPAAE